MTPVKQHPAVTSHADRYACGLCWHAVNIHNLMQGCPVEKCRCMATPGEASNAWKANTPDPLPQDQVRLGYTYPEAQDITDREGRVWSNQEDPPFWFTLATFLDGHKHEVRLVPNGGGKYTLGKVGDPAWSQAVNATSVRTAIDYACLELLPKEPAKVDPEDKFFEDLAATEARVTPEGERLSVTPQWRAMMDTFFGSASEDEPKGVWMTTDDSQNVWVHASEMDALRFVNESNLKGSSSYVMRAYFVEYGKTLSDARGW